MPLNALQATFNPQQGSPCKFFNPFVIGVEWQSHVDFICKIKFGIVVPRAFAAKFERGQGSRFGLHFGLLFNIYFEEFTNKLK